MADPTDISSVSVPVTIVISGFSAVASFILAGLGWFLNHTLHKLEKTLEKSQEDIDELYNTLSTVEARTRAEREASCRDVNQTITLVRQECRECLAERRAEHTHCVDTFGKFGSRLSRLEGEHRAQMMKGGHT